MKLAEYLAQENISQSEFARRIGRSPGLVCQLLRGAWLSPETAQRIMDETNGLVTANDFVAGAAQ